MGQSRRERRGNTEAVASPNVAAGSLGIVNTFSYEGSEQSRRSHQLMIEASVMARRRLLTSELVICSQQSTAEDFTLSRVENYKVMGLGDEDAPEDPQRQESIAVGCAGESFWGVRVCEKWHPGEFK